MAAALVWPDEDEGLADPGTVRLPALLGDRQAVEAYLGDEGSPLLELMDLIEREVLAVPPEEAGCRRLIERRLPDIASPARLLLLASRIPNDAMADMAVAYVGAAVDLVGACARGEPVHTTNLEFAQVVLRRQVEAAEEP